MKKAMSGVKATSSAITTVGHMRRNDVVRTTYGLSDADMSALEAKEASFRARDGGLLAKRSKLVVGGGSEPPSPCFSRISRIATDE